jgi:hypothetical protein
MITCEAMRHTCAAIMTNHSKLVNPRCLHDFDLILCRGPLGISEMILPIRWFTAIAIATEIGHDDGKILGESLAPLYATLCESLDSHVAIRLEIRFLP